MIYLCLFVFLLSIQTTAFAEDSGLELASGWQGKVIAECGDDYPDMLRLSANQQYLYQSCETRENMLSPSLARIHIATGHREILIYGLGHADGLVFAPDGALWLGEELKDGLVWRIEDPDRLQAEQRIDRHRLRSSSPQISAVLSAGTFAHEGLAFSKDGKFLYMADEWKEGCLYRLNMKTKVLKVFHETKGWLMITKPQQARAEAERLHGKWYHKIEDMELMPDGRILMSETKASRILQLEDTNDQPKVTVFLQRPEIKRPDNLEWDRQRGWLWIADDSETSALWAWDGKKLHHIARHEDAGITGMESGEDGTIYLNLQNRSFAPDLTMQIFQK